MHAITAGWVGQTFALAKCNESGGKKSRIRQSKEERKEMVESFIKKYQSLNNGNFPSLNLTHKEVGGSFYTVREIVREIIQENRVLGPGKLPLEEKENDELLEQYPLGKVSLEPQTSLSISPNGSPVHDQHVSSGEVPDLISEQHADPKHHGSNNGKVINGSHVIIKNEVSDPKVAEVAAAEPLATERRVEEVAAFRAKVAPVADVIVETFPLPSLTKQADNSNRNSDEGREIDRNSVEKDMEKLLLGSEHDIGNSISLPERISSLHDDGLLDDNKVEKPMGSVLEKTSETVDEKAVENLGDRASESSNSSITKEDVPKDAEVDVDVKVRLSHDDKAIVETKVVNAPNNTQTKSLGRYSAMVGGSQLITKEVEKQDKAFPQHSGGSQKESTRTLNRIKLESWGGASKSESEAETIPLLAILKSFVAAFMKFWSE